MSSRAKSKSSTSGAKPTVTKTPKTSQAPARPRTAAKKPASSGGRGVQRSESGRTAKPALSTSGVATKRKLATKGTSSAKTQEATKAKPSARASAARKTKAATQPKPRKKTLTRLNGFAVGDHVVYPAHGVGRITGIDEHAVADQTLQMFVVAFEKDKMTLLVPTHKVASAGMRRLSSRETMDAAISTLRGRARTRRVMWSRRAQEYEAKLNSGDPVSIAEVVRDLHRNVGQPDQSYSERQMYEAALERLAREFAAVESTDTDQAATKLEDVLRAA